MFKTIKGYSKYAISENGEVRKGEKIVGQRYDKNGYVRVQLKNDEGNWDTRLVHQLVLETFVGECPEGFEADHIDRNRANNNLENLRWVSRKDNNMNKGKRNTVSSDCKKQVKCVETGEIFKNSNIAAKTMFPDNKSYHVADYIRHVCRHDYGFKSYKGFTFEFVD